MGMPMRRYLTAVPGLAAVWGAGWPGACAVVLVVVVIAAYRLLAERERRKTLLVTYLYAPVGTVMARGKDPAGPQLGVWVGGGHSPVPAPAAVLPIAPCPSGRARPARRRRR